MQRLRYVISLSISNNDFVLVAISYHFITLFKVLLILVHENSHVVFLIFIVFNYIFIVNHKQLHVHNKINHFRKMVGEELMNIVGTMN